MRIVVLLAAVATLAVSTGARAQVAVAVTLPDQNAAHRDIAAGVVSRLREQWDFVHPPLAAGEIALCRAEAMCLKTLAVSRGASHLLLLGVAGIGVRDAIVTAQLIAADGTVVFDENAVAAGSAQPFNDGEDLASRVFAAVSGIPPPTKLAERSTQASRSAPLTMVGASLMGVGTIVAGGAIAWSALSTDDPKQHNTIMATAIGGTIVGCAALATGAALIVIDGL